MSDLSDTTEGAAFALSGSGYTASARGLESPSLFNPAAGADSATAYEVKFLLTEEQAAEVVARVTGKLALDPYADPALGNAYITTSVYTDTPNFDVFYRTEGYDRDKFRVRRYGLTGPVFVERKTKNGDKVRKHRVRISASEVPDLAAPELNGEWAGEWFHSQLLQKQLRPVCRVAYERVAYLGTADGGTVRLTFDRNIRGVLAGEWKLEAVGPVPALVDKVVTEFKFRTAMPALFKGIVADLGLTPTPVSKYRTFVHAAGLAPVRTVNA
ncbi:polyphosphate polymerase domain-containing protein [Gemmata sp. G18]|uniref:Polyphosphate polymerase domain-containing protein n=1 Tax=Gemmata palustris TaxID=2822762 RepID=A0ABS5C3X4_9BACT|nr:polyphosphate polymerase domain-containing protein [Gemmata palustris]MBP3960372.1 polyphosphate polymerase domain-containing protein [Gemmata palustris]